MTKYEWTKKQIAEATEGHPPENMQYFDAFLAEVQKAGESLTRTRFFELFEQCRPARDADYFDYAFLDDHFAYGVANFAEAWNMVEHSQLPTVTARAMYGDLALPQEFCRFGGEPDWIQSVDFPICKECDANMVLFLQVKSLPYELTKDREELRAFTFGDAGNFYVFHCPKCGTYNTSAEGY